MYSNRPESGDRGRARIVTVEVEGDSQALAEALRAFAHVGQAGQPVPVVAVPVALPAPAKARGLKRGGPPKAMVRPTAEPRQTGIPKGPVRLGIREALALAPSTNQELTRFLLGKRISLKDNAVSGTLWAMKTAGEVAKDGDGRWHLVA
jgi:hypothetical protein